MTSADYLLTSCKEAKEDGETHHRGQRVGKDPAYNAHESLKELKGANQVDVAEFVAQEARENSADDVERAEDRNDSGCVCARDANRFTES